ncbi:FAD-dependent oxidoreductase [Xylanimonas ulmi]|uniref:3-oxosteroid 1-dehydrogenase n=1 Tax=Xylanimonas ulmi TaxID=228973 RepID=A0A4Q7M072_9MICO|nr:FAD-dependent oxidoreductase [Xylanibacterium ulmi]RZS60724.1 3-oxosteroid 1-dehydrogenase [Xylanibacterium ulmi]
MTGSLDVDLLVAGSGAAGLTAALTARDAGLSVLLVESTELIGGSSATSGGGLWAPGHGVLSDGGQPRPEPVDDVGAAARYLAALTGDDAATSPARQLAFLNGAAPMVSWLHSQGFAFDGGLSMADYYLDVPGASRQGREVVPARWDARALGPWAERVRKLFPLPVHAAEVGGLALAGRTRSGLTTAARVAVASAGGMLRGGRIWGAGRSLVGQLLHLCLRAGVQVWLDAPVSDLVTDAGGNVTAAIVTRAGRRVDVRTARGVVLATGGFARDPALRAAHLPVPSTSWTVAAPGDLGDGILAGRAVGAAWTLMDEAWWGPTIIGPGGRPQFVLWERSMPHAFLVDRSGQRFCDESGVLEDVGRALLEVGESWLLLDARHRASYPFGWLPPRVPPVRWLASGAMIRDRSLARLATRTGIDADGLRDTARRFAGQAITGVDLDFGRGATEYDRTVYADPRVRPNPNLGAVSRPPFYAVPVHAGDVGTKGGLLTDGNARVLRVDGEPIRGLYAAGNTAASVMGRSFPAPGATLGPAMTFGYVAGLHAAGRSSQ